MDDTEYNDEILEEIINFHGRSSFINKQLEPVPDFGDFFHGATTAIEISRGCQHHCNFCCEPYVKGHHPRLRSLDVVEEEIRFLMRSGVRYFWFVRSELNCNRTHSLELAERIIKINEDNPQFPVIWRSYFLPVNFSYDDMKLLLKSGLQLEQNSNFSSLDDDNLSAMREPYRSKDAVAMTKNQIDLLENDPDLSLCTANPMRMLWPFTANHFSTPKTVARTARIFNEEGLSDLYQGVLSYMALRVHPCLKDLPDNIYNGTVSVCNSGRLEKPDLIHPSFYYSQSLVKQLGSIPELLDFLEYFHNTFMSTYYRVTRDWLWFANKYLSPATLSKLIRELGADFDIQSMEEEPWSDHIARESRNGMFSIELVESILSIPDTDEIANLLNPLSVGEEMIPFYHPVKRDQCEGFVSLLLYILFMERGRLLLKDIFSYLNIPTDQNGTPVSTPYFFMKGFYKHYTSNDDLMNDIRNRFSLDEDDLTLFLFRYLIYQFNVKIRPEYASVLYE